MPDRKHKYKWSGRKDIRRVRSRSYEIEADSRKYVRNRKYLRKYMPVQELGIEESAYQ